MQKRVPAEHSTVAVVGLGKIGLPLAIQYASHDWRVIGCDSNPRVVEVVNAGLTPVEEPGVEAKLAGYVEQGQLSATVDTTEAVRQANVVVVIVPVVVDEQHNVDFAGIDAATRAVGAGLQSGALVIYETTLPVSTTSKRLRDILEREARLRAGQDFYLAYSPERVSSGSIFRDLRIYPKIVGGIDAPSTEAAVAFYRSTLDAEVITMASSDDAEFVKLIETTYRDVNIALANEFACFADARGLEVFKAIAAANTQPYSHIHMPGVGVGGHCIPVYPYFLLTGVEECAERQLPSEDPALLSLPRAARQINDGMAAYAVRRLEGVVGPLAGKAVLILGVAYRGDVRETAFTSAKLLREALVEHGATVYADDPLFGADELLALGYRPMTAEARETIQAIILQASHQVYQQWDFSDFAHCQGLLDGRGALQQERIEAAGIHYIVIGDGERERIERRGDGQRLIASSVWDGGEEE